jgi:hypothetical protein
MDQPAVALDMISRFINQQSFEDFPLPVEGEFYRPSSAFSKLMMPRPVDEYQNAEIPTAYKSSATIPLDTPFSSSSSWGWISASLALLLVLYAIRQLREKR